ncbi:MAG: SAM-dependent methyltransferase [Bacteroidetes bacterium SW_11_45_7]|nr:MAG: SAM-dependent methyltransferase [Bacteroidetes bacterium SW_11_45_7]
MTLEDERNYQSQGDVAEKPPETDDYQAEYVEGFVDKWDDLIDWDARGKGEGDFFIKELKERGKNRILDVATGTGYHSVKLQQNGFEVDSADGSPNMLAKAFNNAKSQGLILRTIHADWRWLNRDVHNKYDAIICLGNSFTHLFSENDRRKALAEFYSALRHDGILILDQRNYDVILDQGFKTKHTFYYAGENVKAEPDIIKDNLVRFSYEFPDGEKYHLKFFPLRKEYTTKLMKEVGFQQVTTYGDFKETYGQDDPDYYIHIAEKAYIPEDD